MNIYIKFPITIVRSVDNSEIHLINSDGYEMRKVLIHNSELGKRNERH